MKETEDDVHVHDRASRIILLATATVDPLKCKSAKFSPLERAIQYRTALVYNLAQLANGRVDGIVFAENSGYDLTEFKALVDPTLLGKVEFLTYSPESFDSRLGKGYNEELLMDRVLDDSKLIRESDFVVKVTGRYSICTLLSHLRDMRRKLPDLDFFMDTKDHRLFSMLGLKWGQRWTDVRVWGFSPVFYRKCVYGRENELLNEYGNIMEMQMFALTRRVRQNSRCCFRFSQPVRIKGLNGGNYVQVLNCQIPERWQGIYFGINWLYKFCIRKMLPWVWL